MADTKQTKMGDLDKVVQQESVKYGGNPFKPGIGVDTTSPFSIGTIGGSRTTPSTSTVTRDPTDTNAVQRGDYIIKQGQSTVVPNTVTDIVQKNLVVYGGKEKQGLTFSDFSEALSKGLMARLGAPTESDDALKMLASGASSQTLSKMPIIRDVWAFGNFLSSIGEAQERYNSEYDNQIVDYDTGVEFYTGKDGKRKARIQYSKMSTAGEGSGENVFNSIKTDNTSVSLGDNGAINVNVSPVFASSKEYLDVLEKIKEYFPSMNSDIANQIVDEDTGTTVLKAIEDEIKGAEARYYFNTRVAKEIKDIAPNASDEAINDAVYTQMSGYVSDKSLESLEISVYNEENQKETINAKDFFDSIANMSKLEREDYMLSIGNRISSQDISDDERAILQGQANALYAVSYGDGAYKGIYNKDFFDTVGDTSSLIFGIRLGDFVGARELTTFADDDISTGLLTIASTAGRAFSVSKIANSLEGMFRKVPGLSILSNYAPQDTPIKIGEQSSFGQFLGKTATQVGFQVASDATFEALKMGAYNLAGKGEEFDFLDELKTDMLLDALMTYGPNVYAERMHRTKYEYRPVEEKYYLEDVDGNRISDEPIIEKTSKLVEVTAEELAQRRAATIDKLTDSKIGLRVQELFADKNAAMSKLAVQVKQVTGDNFLYRRMLRYSSDIRQLTKFSLSEFKSEPIVSKHFSELGTKIRDYAPKARDFTRADEKYINALENQRKMLDRAGGDAKAEKQIKDFYEKDINGVTEGRAAQLNDLMDSIRDISKDIVDFYERKGLLSKEQADELRQDKKYMPVWSKNRTYSGGDVLQERAAIKSIYDSSELISTDDLENPLVTIAQSVNNAARNAALNDRLLAIRDAASIAGVKLHIYEDSGGALSDVSNLKALDKDFQKIYDGLRKKTFAQYPSREKWQKENDKIILESKAMSDAKALTDIQKEATSLKKQLRNAKDSESIEKIKTSIDNNKEKQLKLIDGIKKESESLISKAAKMNKGDLKLDIQSYVDVQLSNDLKKVLSKGASTGKIQAILNKAVEKANPWVDPSSIFHGRVEEAALEFRKKINKEIKLSSGNSSLDRINNAVDRVYDFVVSKALGKQGNTVTRLSDDEPTTFVSNPRNTSINYRMNGKSYTMSFTGKGAEELVRELKSPEFSTPKTTGGQLWSKIYRLGNKVAQAKRYLTTSADVTRVLPNLARDWSRGIVTTGGDILLSPDELRKQVIENSGYGKEEIDIINRGFNMVKDVVEESTLTKSLETPKKNRAKSMIKALNEPDGNAFVRFIYDFKNKSAGEKISFLQDTAETFTRTRAMENAYYKELSDSAAAGRSIDESIKRATEAAYFYGEEATTNFYRRGELVSKIAQQVPYFSTRFASIESFKYSYLDNPVATMRSLETTVTTYAALIAIALSNEESRKRYYMLSEYDRSNNIIIPLDNENIITIPLDDTIAAFLTPYRRMVETLNGVDPEAFYLWGAEFLGALSPLDLSGFSEGDKFNVVRGFEKLGSQMAPSWALPILESMTGTDWYYGSNIRVDSDYTGLYYDNWDPTYGEMTTTSNNSQLLSNIANNTGIPQWILQEFLSEYGGNVGQYAINMIDKASGAPEDSQGGREWQNSIWKSFTGNDSDNAKSAFYEGVSILKEDKKKLKNQISDINTQIKSSTGDAKAKLQEDRRKKIQDYGLKVSDFVNQYLSAYEITGGLSKKQASQVYYLYQIYDENSDRLYTDESGAGYYASKEASEVNRKTAALAAESGIDKYYRSPADSYYDTYAEQALRNTTYGYGMNYVDGLYNVIEKGSNSLYNARQQAYDARSAAFKAKNYDAADAAAYQYDYQMVATVYKYIADNGYDVEDVIGNNKVIDYLKDWIIVPSDIEKTKQGRFFSLPSGAEKDEAFKKMFIKNLFGVE